MTVLNDFVYQMHVYVHLIHELNRDTTQYNQIVKDNFIQIFFEQPDKKFKI
jgi:hypothetical protein